MIHIVFFTLKYLCILGLLPDIDYLNRSIFGVHNEGFIKMNNQIFLIGRRQLNLHFV